MQRERSARLFREALRWFPGGVNSPVRAFRSVTGPPLFIESGSGCHIRDADGNNFIDYCGSWGPLILGHADPRVISAVEHALRKGTSFGAPTGYENSLAEIILSQHHGIQKIRFVSSGTEAVMSALRLARGVSGREKIIKFGGCYHGHSDAMLVKAGSGLATQGISSSRGIPEGVVQDTLVSPLDAEDALNKIIAQYGNEVACIIIEPVPANNGLLLQRKEFLQHVREVCTQHHILLIFDEVISGFRIGFTGASGYYGITPDIVTFGKVIGGGLPVGAFAASSEIMDHVAPEGDVYQAGTLSGNPLSMAAGIAQLTACLEDGFYDSLQSKTELLAGTVNAYTQKENIPIRIHSIGSIFWISFSGEDHVRRPSAIPQHAPAEFNALHDALLSRGIYLGPSAYEVCFVSAAHEISDLEFTASAICESIGILYKRV